MTTACRESGFTLVEVLIASSILAILAGGASLLAAIPARSLMRTRAEAVAMQSASARLEQLRGLTWGFGSVNDMQPGFDTTSALAASVRASGGRGLDLVWPSLDADVPGQVDYLNASGAWVGTSPGSPARFVRRWGVVPLPAPSQALVLAVRVIDLRRMVSDVHLVTIKARVAG
jgi:prepilin-type N-terminal cleavage/methylation domain-containing protein